MAILIWKIFTFQNSLISTGSIALYIPRTAMCKVIYKVIHNLNFVELSSSANSIIVVMQ